MAKLSAKKQASIEKQYRNLKKFLNKYHKFSFPMPKKGQTFTPQQKTAITRIFNKVGYHIDKVAREKQSFIPYPKGSKLKLIDGVRTNKGIFYKFQGAKAKQIIITDAAGRKRKDYTVQIDYKILREIFIPFPPSIIDDINAIEDFVSKQAKKLKPEYMMWSKSGSKSRNLYDVEAFNKYLSDMSLNKEDELIEYALENLPEYNGVFFGWY
jgi:hypothetical protein